MAIRTMQDWKDSRVDFGRFADFGDEVDDAIVEYFTGVVPPKTLRSDLVQCGEAVDCNAQGQPTYTTFQKIGDKWIYLTDSIAA